MGSILKATQQVAAHIRRGRDSPPGGNEVCTRLRYALFNLKLLLVSFQSVSYTVGYLKIASMLPAFAAERRRVCSTAPQIRSHDFWRYINFMYMYKYM